MLLLPLKKEKATLGRFCPSVAIANPSVNLPLVKLLLVTPADRSGDFLQPLCN